MTTLTINEQVKSELHAIKVLGIRVPKAAFKLADEDLSEYDNMSVSEIADLLIELA